MLSFRIIRDAAHVQHYFSIDDLTVESRLSSGWEGQWARTWRLAPPVDPTVFRDVLEGRLPGGTRGPTGTTVRGVDATFSAPKSVSVAALVWGDRRLVDAHDQAVRETLSWIEAEHCYFQKHIGRSTAAMAGGGLLAATFRHGLSRLADPQLHTHCVIPNLTATPDGTFRALDRIFLFNAAKLLGGYYRLDLAARVAGLGYTIRPTPHAFEIGEISGRLLALWSKRSHAVEQALSRAGSSRDFATQGEKQYLTLQTRPPKTASSWAEIAGRWREEYGRIQPDRVPLAPWRAPGEPRVSRPFDLAGLVGEIVRELGAEYGDFRRIEIYGRLFSRAVGRVDGVSLRWALPGLLQGMTVPATNLGGRNYCFGNDWHACPTPQPTTGRNPQSGSIFYLCWGNARDLLAQFRSVGLWPGPARIHPEPLRAPWALLGRGSGVPGDSKLRPFLFYLPRGIPLTALDAVLEWVRGQGVGLVLVEWPRREYGLLRLRGLDHLKRSGENVTWLRHSDRDAFVSSHDWQPVPELERLIGLHHQHRHGNDQRRDLEARSPTNPTPWGDLSR
jgi:conjugative relaxase-like TrwC/TraI family protein